MRRSASGSLINFGSRGILASPAARALGMQRCEDGYDLALASLNWNAPQRDLPDDPPELQVMRVRSMAALALGQIGRPDALGPLKQLMENGDDPRVQLAAIIDGGGHERGMRSGTLNVTGIVGLGKACEICQSEMAEESVRLGGLRDRLKENLFARLDEIFINGSMEHRLPNNLNISFAYVEGESLLMGINDVAVSSGSACTSATLEPSYVLKALGVGDDLAHTSIRFGLGRFTTAEEVDYVTERVVETVKRLRELSPLYEMAKEGVDLKKMQWSATASTER